jgi:hypothetical protein
MPPWQEVNVFALGDEARVELSPLKANIGVNLRLKTDLCTNMRPTVQKAPKERANM